MKTTYVHLNTQLYDLKSKSRSHCWRHEIVQHFNVQQTEHDLDWSGPDALHCLKTWYHRKCNSRTHFRHCKIAKRFRQHINKKRRWNDCWLLRCTNLEGGFLSEQLSVWKFFLFQLEIHGAFQKMYLDRSSPKKTFMCFCFFGVKMNPFEQKQRVIPDTRFSHTVHPDSQETSCWVFLLLLFYSQLIIWIIKTANRKYPLQLFAVPGKRKRQIKRTTLNFWLGFHFYSDPLLIMRDLKITNIQEGRRVSTFVIRTYLFQNNRCLK